VNDQSSRAGRKMLKRLIFFSRHAPVERDVCMP
jgi:hypothetical protein